MFMRSANPRVYCATAYTLIGPCGRTQSLRRRHTRSPSDTHADTTPWRETLTLVRTPSLSSEPSAR